MEQNKIYIIVLIVTLVTAGMIAAGVFLLTPGEDARLAAQQTDEAQTVEPFIYLRETPLTSDMGNPSGTQALTQSGEPPVSSGQSESANENTANGSMGSELAGDQPALIISQEQRYGANPDQISSEPASALSDGTRVGAQASDEKPTGTSRSAGTRPVNSGRATSNDASNAAVQPSQTSASQASNVSSADSASAQRSPQQVQEYWIQVFASTSLDSIEAVREELDAHGLGGRISTTENGDTLYYRLRYGPFEVRDEAQKFLDWLREGTAYDTAYISLEYHQR